MKTVECQEPASLIFSAIKPTAGVGFVLTFCYASEVSVDGKNKPCSLDASFDKAESWRLDTR